MVLAGGLVLAGCGGGEGDDGAAPSTTAASATDDDAGAASTTVAPDGGEADAVEVDASEGCGTPPDAEPVGTEPPGDVEMTFDAAGVERIYRIGVPADYDPEVPVPLVVNLHGSGSDANQASLYGDVPRQATERGMITVAPQAIDGQWELPGEGADADFLAALVDDVEARYCIDLDRVHAIGMSLGAWKAAVTACVESDRYASVALVTVEVHPGDCAPMAAVAFHGTADPVVAYGEEGGGTVDDAATPNAGLPPTLTNMEGWATGAGCATEPEVTPMGDDVEHRVYPGCDEGLDVELYTVLGGGHTWPGSEIVIGLPEWTTDTVDATQLALDWFEAHPRQG